MQSQRGITITGFIFFTVFFVYFCILAMRFLPIYMQNYTLQKSLESFTAMPKNFYTGSASVDMERIRNRFMSQLVVDGIEEIPRDALKITPQRSQYLLTLTYERRVGLIANIDAVVHFDLQQTVDYRVE
jgi:Domain of unknown function (DUF4845)